MSPGNSRQPRQYDSIVYCIFRPTYHSSGRLKAAAEVRRYALQCDRVLNMRVIYLFLIIILTLLIVSCTSTSMKIYRAAGKPTICDGKNEGLGHIVVLPETAWRNDQKEPAKRASMALEEIKNAFQGFPCGSLSVPGGIKNFSSWSSKLESELLKQFSIEGVDTIILLRFEELTPYIYFTFSLPILWAGSNEADFRIRMLSVKTGDVLTDMRVRRTTGGPFNIRPAEWSRDELKAALHDIIGKGKTE